jgi:hypothetical protein
MVVMVKTVVMGLTVPTVQMVLSDLWGHAVLKAIKAIKGTEEMPVHVELRVIQAILVLEALKVIKGIRVQLAPRVLEELAPKAIKETRETKEVMVPSLITLRSTVSRSTNPRMLKIFQRSYPRVTFPNMLRH